MCPYWSCLHSLCRIVAQQRHIATTSFAPDEQRCEPQKIGSVTWRKKISQLGVAMQPNQSALNGGTGLCISASLEAHSKYNDAQSHTPTQMLYQLATFLHGYGRRPHLPRCTNETQRSNTHHYNGYTHPPFFVSGAAQDFGPKAFCGCSNFEECPFFCCQRCSQITLEEPKFP